MFEVSWDNSSERGRHLGFSEGHRQGTEQPGGSPELSLSPGSPFPEQSLSTPAEIPPPSALLKELL